MDYKIIYEDKDLLVIDKPPGITVFSESPSSEKTLADILVQEKPEVAQAGDRPRYGIAHRLDKDTSGILLVAKNKEYLTFLQKQFKEKTVAKKYVGLAVGTIKEDEGTIETGLDRSPQD